MVFYNHPHVYFAAHSNIPSLSIYQGDSFAYSPQNFVQTPPITKSHPKGEHEIAIQRRQWIEEMEIGLDWFGNTKTETEPKCFPLTNLKAKPK